MKPVTPEALLVQLEETIERLSAPAEVQWLWIYANEYPVHELTAEFTELVWPLWRDRLSESGQVDSQDERLLDELAGRAESITNVEHNRLFSRESLETANEWQEIRELAARTLESLQRSPAEKRSRL